MKVQTKVNILSRWIAVQACFNGCLYMYMHAKKYRFLMNRSKCVDTFVKGAWTTFDTRLGPLSAIHIEFRSWTDSGPTSYAD